MKSVLAVASILLATAAVAAAAPAYGDLLVTGNGKIFNITSGGDVTGDPPFAFNLGGSLDLCRGPNGDFYVTEFSLMSVSVVPADGGDASGAAPFATGLDLPVALACTPASVLVTEFSTGMIKDITAGGEFAGAPAFATGIPGLMGIFRSSDGRLWATSTTASGIGRVLDVTAGGDFSSATPYATSDSRLRGMGELNGELYVAADDGTVRNFTAGGALDSTTIAASIPGVIAVLGVPTRGLFAASSTTVYSISAGSATPFATAPLSSAYIGLLYFAPGDYDLDGALDVEDNCPAQVNVDQADDDGDGLGDACDPTNDLDVDADLISNTSDNCPFDANASQDDADGDGLGDACDPTNDLDVDSDTILNTDDNCPFVANQTQTDADGDGLGDACDTANGLDVDDDAILNTDDNCPFDANQAQTDTDGDGLGDACDTSNGLDVDDDGIANAMDNCAFAVNADQADADGDGLGDACDATDGNDLDGDGVENTADNCPFVANGDQADIDNDGLGTECDPKNDLSEEGGCCSAGGDPAAPAVLSLICMVFVLRRRVSHRRA